MTYIIYITIRIQFIFYSVPWILSEWYLRQNWQGIDWAQARRLEQKWASNLIAFGHGFIRTEINSKHVDAEQHDA